jgi:hypothetical protein
MGRKVLYNLLRMNWLQDPATPCEPWQVEDYREVPEAKLFDRFSKFGFSWDRHSFLAAIEEFDDPEQMADALCEGIIEDPIQQDKVFLLVFELWRRIGRDKLVLDFFCDELDYQIDLYDRGAAESLEGIQNAIAELQTILDENVDEGGGEPQVVFRELTNECANDIERFLYDFIADQLDNGQLNYAQELVDGFMSYVEDNRWLQLLWVRILSERFPREADEQVAQLVRECLEDPDLELNLEILAFLMDRGQKEQFISLAEATATLIEEQEDFAELLEMSIEFFNRLDCEAEEQSLSRLLQKYQSASPDQFFQFKEERTLFLEILRNYRASAAS